VLLQRIAGTPALPPDMKALPLLKAGCSTGEWWLMLLPTTPTTTASAAVGRGGSSLP